MASTRITINHAESRVGTIGFPSKMPGTSFGIPARHCSVGAKLHAIEGSVCSDCYALKNRYAMSNVLASEQNRFDKLNDPEWPVFMAFLLNRYHGLIDGHVDSRIDPNGDGWHRWHDAGDVQSEEHLDNIVRVCELTPTIKHWLPTREIGLLARWLKSRFGATLEQMNNVIPANLCIRVSATMVDGRPTSRAPNTSTVHSATTAAQSDRCVAPDHAGKCGPCRKCWDKTHANTGYEGYQNG